MQFTSNAVETNQAQAPVTPLEAQVRSYLEVTGHEDTTPDSYEWSVSSFDYNTSTQKRISTSTKIDFEECERLRLEGKEINFCLANVQPGEEEYWQLLGHSHKMPFRKRRTDAARNKVSSPEKLKAFDVREWVHRLTPVEGRKNEYLCPKCDKKLTIDLDEGAYRCWANDPLWSIREAIAPSSPKSKKVITTPPDKPKPAASEKVVALTLIETRQEHIKEWVEGSGISEELTKLNLRSIDDEKEIAGLLGWNNYFNGPGWYVRSVDPLTGMYTDSGQFKPDIPIVFEEGGKPKKYITFPKDKPLRPVFPVVDMATWEAIAQKHGLEFRGSIDESRHDKGFWKWVLENPQIAIIEIEGIKKGECLLTNSHAPIILPGVWGGQQKNKTQLKEDLDLFIVPSRPVFLGFDSDLHGNKSVKSALDNLAKLHTEKGCVPKVLDWGVERGKGIDDFILSQGIGALDELMAKAPPYDEWRLKLEAQFQTKKSASKGKSEKREKLPPPDVLGEEMAEDYRDKLAYNDVTGIWMRYGADYPGVWSPETPEFIEAMVSGDLKKRGISGYGGHGFVVNIVKKLRCELLQRRWKQPSANELLPFFDGVLEIATGKLLLHSPGYKFTWALERSHDNTATDWSLIEKFLDHATGRNAALKEILVCYAAAVLRGRSDLQKFLHLIGVAGSGKGVYTRLLIDLIGAVNCHITTLEDWCGNRFEAANADRKRLIAFCDEDKRSPQLGKFKSLTGGDWLRAEEKGKKAYQYLYEGMVLVASNFPIFAGDNSSALTRRTITVPMNATTADSERRDLNKEFQPQLAAFTNYLLTIPSQQVTDVLRGRKEVPEVAQQSWENRIRTDSIASWLNDKVIRDPMATTPIGNDAEDENALFGNYVTYCKKAGTQSRANRTFSSDLLELCQAVLGWTEVEKDVKRTGKFIKGLRLRDSKDYEIPTHDFNLLQAVTDSVADCDGKRNGLEPLLHKAVTDCDGLNEFSEQNSKKVDNAAQLPMEMAAPDDPGGGESTMPDTPPDDIEKVETVVECISVKDEASNPSRPVTALAGKGFDPSHLPSHLPSQHPSQSITDENHSLNEGAVQPDPSLSRPSKRVEIGYAISLPKDLKTPDVTIAEILEVEEVEGEEFFIVAHPTLGRQRYPRRQVRIAKAPNGEHLHSWTVKKDGVEQFTLGMEYPGTRGRNQVRECKEIAGLLKQIQSKSDWEAIAEGYGEEQATWVWRWYFNKADRDTLKQFMSGKVEQGELEI